MSYLDNKKVISLISEYPGKSQISFQHLEQIDIEWEWVIENCKHRNFSIFSQYNENILIFSDPINNSYPERQFLPLSFSQHFLPLFFSQHFFHLSCDFSDFSYIIGLIQSANKFKHPFSQEIQVIKGKIQFFNKDPQAFCFDKA